MDKNELKAIALKERVATLTADYEEKIADLRVELTVVTNELERLKASQTQQDANPDPKYPQDFVPQVNVVPGEVVEDVQEQK